MKTAYVPNSWIQSEGCRLDPRPYVNGTVQLQNLLLKFPHARLSDVTAGFKGGIFTHLFSPKRTYVSDKRYGVPFLGASSMRLSDLGDVPILSARDAASRSYAPLKIHKGMTLISCSGLIGSMVYARSDMDGMASAGDILKVQPNSNVILPGYLFAYLSCRIGAILVGSGTYGTIVQHLETQHVAGISVPRLSPSIEERAHHLVEEAAICRTRASSLLREARDQVRELFPTSKPAASSTWSTVNACKLQSRLDAYYYSALCISAIHAFETASAERHLRLAEVADVFIPGIFKRRYAQDASFGYPYVTGGDVFQISPSSDRHILRSVAEQYRLLVRRGMILIQEAGQVGGLIGRSVLTGSRLDGFAVSNNMVRVITHDPEDAGYLYALLSTPEGIVLLAREAAGSSIPHLEVRRVRDLKIPWPEPARRREIGHKVMHAIDLRDRACVSEDEARSLVECTIEEVG
jgi:type I restriction enzyme S subunit